MSVEGPDSVHVEHIIPLKIKTKKAKEEFGDWISYLGPNAEAHHPKYVGRIGNLTLLAKPLNIGASNNPYKRKAQAYSHSGIKITQSLPFDYRSFKFKQVDKRSEDFADIAIEIWKIA